MGLIYCFTSPSGKKYVGKTERDLETRIKEHVIHARIKRRAFFSAINKYGIEAFLIETLCEGIDDPDSLSVLEQEYIAKFKQDGFTLYNHTDGGEGITGMAHSEKAKKAISSARIKQWQDPDYRSHMSSALKWKDDEKRVNNLVEKNKGMHADPEYKAKLMDGLRSYLDKPETKEAKKKRFLGSNNPMAKHSPELVLEIKSLVDSGMTQTRAGQIVGVSNKVVNSIMTGSTWSHVTGIEKRGKSTNKSIQPYAKD